MTKVKIKGEYLSKWCFKFQTKYAGQIFVPGLNNWYQWKPVYKKKSFPG
mgnify:CR=1 FL=1